MPNRGLKAPQGKAILGGRIRGRGMGRDLGLEGTRCSIGKD